VKSKVSAHLQETNKQLRRLEQCLQACGSAAGHCLAVARATPKFDKGVYVRNG
jgi:ferritin-like metal-binding protein YciE